MSSGAEKAITYEEVKAYQASEGIDMYALPSGGTATGGFVVYWDLDSGFTGVDWDDKNSVSPAYGSTDESRRQDAADGNLNTMFGDWAARVPFKDRLNWVTNWMNEHGCVSEG